MNGLNGALIHKKNGHRIQRTPRTDKNLTICIQDGPKIINIGSEVFIYCFFKIGLKRER